VGQKARPDRFWLLNLSGLGPTKTSKVIVAVNKEREAPIKSANYGIAGNLSKVMPLFEKEF